MNDANVLKDAQKVNPARNKFRETEASSGLAIKLSIAAIIGHALALAKDMLFGSKADAEQAPAELRQEAAGEEEVASVEPAQLEQGSTAQDESQPAAGDAEVPDAPRRGSGTSFTQPLNAEDVSIPAGDNRPAGEHRGVKVAFNDNAPTIGAGPGFLLSLPQTRDLAASGGTGDGAGGGNPSAPGPSNEESTDPLDDRNRAPEVKSPLRFGSTFVNQAIVISALDLLRFASDADANPLRVGGVIAGPGATLRQIEGNWILTPTADFKGHVEIAFSVTDGQASSIGRTVIEVLDFAPSLIVGTADSDAIVGTDRPDTIEAIDGDDDVVGREGADVIRGDGGNDRIAGGAGDDVIYGGDGNDMLLGQGGHDVLFGQAGDDVLEGGEGNDALFGGDGADLLFGEEGNDVLVGGAGADSLDGGDGDDTFIAEANDGDDVIEGGVGQDTLDLSATDAAAIVDLAAGMARSAQIGDDSLSGVENVLGGAGDDDIRGDDAANVVEGGGGDDLIQTRDGDDRIVASVGDGNDHVDGGQGTDILDLGQTSIGVVVDLETGQASGLDIGSDTIANIENVVGGRGNDVFVANDLVNVLSGGSGDDVFVFRSSSSAGLGRGNRDKILDFEPGDRIDLDDVSREFDRKFGDIIEDAGFKKFVLMSSGEPFSEPGQIRFAYEEIDGRTYTIVEGNTDTDAATEFEIELTGRIALHEDHIGRSGSQSTQSL